MKTSEAFEIIADNLWDGKGTCPGNKKPTAATPQIAGYQKIKQKNVS